MAYQYLMRLESKFIKAKTESTFSNQDVTDFKIMLVMHGLGDSMEPYEMLTREINVTGCNYLLLNAPQAYFTGLAWFQPNPEVPEEASRASVTLIVNEINHLIEEGFKKEDIILCGFSQGGCMALAAAQAFGEELGGIIALSPKTYPFMMTNVSEEFLRTPLFVAHGEQDSVIPFEQTKGWIDQIADRHRSLSWNKYSMGHEIEISEIQELRNWLNEIL